VDNETFHDGICSPCSATKMPKIWSVTSQCLVASLALASLTVVCYRLHFNLAATALLLMIFVVLTARLGSFFSSIFASIVAALCLAHIAPPAFSFRVDDPLDVVAIIAFLGTSFIVARLMSTVRNQAQEALSSVSHRVIEAEEQARQRIAEKLHEGVGQRLAVLLFDLEQLSLDSLNGADMPSRIDVVVKQSSEILNDVQVLAHELHSPSLDYFGIAVAMKSFCKEFGQLNRVEIDFKSDGLPRFVPPDTSICLFRVLQEALHNAVEHSGVRKFDVQLKGTSEEIHLTVGDCGLGFDPEMAKASRGLGLNHMQERLKLVKGSLSIDSQPKRGTTIHARVPLTLESDSKHEAGRQLT
jgi:signal transduction histidine kinase